MSVMTCSFFSKTLGFFTDVNVYIPSMNSGAAVAFSGSLEELYQPKKYKALYLLHGMLGNHRDWFDGSMVIEQAEKHQIALICPSAQNSFYVNAAVGQKYFDFISRELPLWVEANFPVLSSRENRFIAGLSMGGYGCLRVGLACPDRYAAIGSFSGGIDVDTIARLNGPLNALVDADALFGGVDAIKGSDNDLFALAKKCKATAEKLPEVYLCVGTEDPLTYDMDKEYTEFLQSEGFPVTYMEMPGVHEFKVWNAGVTEFIEMITES